MFQNVKSSQSHKCEAKGEIPIMLLKGRGKNKGKCYPEDIDMWSRR